MDYFGGDYQSRMQGYAIGRQNGWLSANDIRELEDMNPIEDGDIYLVNGNMVSATGRQTKTKRSKQEEERKAMVKREERCADVTELRVQPEGESAVIEGHAVAILIV